MEKNEHTPSRLEQTLDKDPDDEQGSLSVECSTETIHHSDLSSKPEVSRPTADNDFDCNLSRLGSSTETENNSNSVRRMAIGADLSQLEQDILAKRRANSAPLPSTRTISSGGARLPQLEQSVTAKAKALSHVPGARTTTTPGAHAEQQPRTSTKSIELRREPQQSKEEEGSSLAVEDFTSSGGVPRVIRRSSSLHESQQIQLEDLEEALIQKLGEQGDHQHSDAQHLDSKGVVIGGPENAHGEYFTNLSDGATQFILPDGFSQSNITPHGNAMASISTDHGISTELDYEHGSFDGTTDSQGCAFAGEYTIAVPVPDDAHNAALTSAIEYDPDSKPPIYKNRRFIYYGIAASIGLIAVTLVTIMVTIFRPSDHAAIGSITDPTTERERTSILKQLVSVVGEATMDVPGSPAVRAAEWIINEDALQVAPEAEHLTQRFLLVLFYLATTQEKPWKSCNQPMLGETNECNFSKVLRIEPTFAYEDVDNIRWLSTEHECLWAGVFCDEFMQVRAFELQGQMIRGTFPTEIAKLPYLQSLTFMWNEFYGTLPHELVNMKHLLNIELHANFFTGTIPVNWYSSQALQRIAIGNNMLSGTIPTEIGLLDTLKGFHCFDNMLSGTIPTEIGNMRFLSFTRWSRNYFRGPLPSELGNLHKLQEMWIHRNLLTGTMPPEISTMKDLSDMRLHFNTITGSIPEEHYELKQLIRWDLYDMNLTSTISTMIGNMIKLRTFRIRENNFYGTIPTEMAALTGLESVWLQRNNLTGSIPLELCAIRGSKFSQLMADCWATNSVGAPRVQCLTQCCTACCDTVTGFCHHGNEF